jgi:hypothetical protein
MRYFHSQLIICLIKFLASAKEFPRSGDNEVESAAQTLGLGGASSERNQTDVASAVVKLYDSRGTNESQTPFEAVDV